MKITFEAIGTRWEIVIPGRLETPKLQTLTQSIKERIDEFDKTYSRFHDDSVIMQLAKKPGRYELPADAEALFRMYKALYDATDGSVTPLIGQTLDDAGYDAAYSLTPKKHLSKPLKWEEAISYDPPYITAKQPVKVDVGAAGKGYLIDIIGGMMRDTGVNEYMIDASGDILRRGKSGTFARVGLEHPLDPKLAVGVVNLGNQSICGSAGNRRAWGDMHHIIDPKTARPVNDILAVWAVADTALLADGLATALFFTPAHKLAHHFTFEYFLIRSDLSFERSSGLDAEIFGAVE